MKKVTLLLLLFVATANAQLTFTDPALKTYLLSSSLSNSIAQNSAYQNVKIDANSNGQIEASETTVVARLWIEDVAVTSLGGIEGFTNLTELGVKQTGLTAVTLAPGPNLVNINFLENVSLTYLNVSGMSGLIQLAATDNPQLAQLINLNCNALATLIAYNNALFTMDLSGFTNLLNVYLNDNALTTINVSGCTNLNGLNVNNNNLSMIVVDGLTNLVGLYLNDNPNLSIIHAAGCSSLSGFEFANDTAMTYADLSGTAITSLSMTDMPDLATLDVSGCDSLVSVTTSNTALTDLDLTGCTALQSLTSVYGETATFGLSTCIGLKYLTISQNPVATLNLSNLPNLEQAILYNNQLTNLNVSGCAQLTMLSLENNPLAYLNASGCTSLPEIGFPDVGLGSWIDVNFSGCTSFIGVHLISQQLANVNFQGCTALEYAVIGGSSGTHAPLTSIDMSNLPALTDLLCYYTDIASINLGNSALISRLAIYQCNMPWVDFSVWPTLEQLTYSDNNAQTVDVSTLPLLWQLDLNNNMQLKQLFAKNGMNEQLQVQSCPQLEFICQDDAFIATTMLYVTSSGLSNVNINSYCSFTPGGDYNTITGAIRFDHDNNGCDAGDIFNPYVRIDINDGTEAGATFTNEAGNYTFYVPAGDFDLTPDFENSSLFTITPLTATASFADDNNNTVVQNFCVAANGIQPDVEIIIAPIIPARPGFDAWYSITIKNKGNQTVSGDFSFAYDDALMDFIIATQLPTSQSTGLLGWNYNNLSPFESRSIYVNLNINSPVETPAVNIGDELDFTATVNPVAGDFTPADNEMDFEQTVIGSYDPNDITCIEGDLAPITEIGNYLHYVVNFENTGTAEAENIVVRLDIDADKYDVNSLQMINTSHACRTLVTGNKVEFIFEGINLGVASAPPVGGHGNVLFKIKSDDGLTNGDSVANMAKIFFDYNAPVHTNDAETTFQLLNNPGHGFDQSVTIYPNPAVTFVNIKSSFNIQTVAFYDIQGRLLETDTVQSENATLDISAKPKGVYFVKVTTDKGIKVEKIIKE
jgi:hypothetical protein